MCSVVQCDSCRRDVPRFKIPEDPERRLEWVQFLAQVNGQRFKEASWTDITICGEHFTNGSFESLNQTGSLRLKPGAVPTLCIKSEPEEPELDLEALPWKEGLKCEESTGTTEWSPQCELPQTCDSPTSYSQESFSSMGAPVSPEPSDVPRPPDTSEVFSCDYSRMIQKVANIEMIREKATLLQLKGRYVVNEKRLLQLFSSKCPSCGGKVKTEKVVRGVLVILSQQCVQCEYRHQWKSQVNARVPADDDGHMTGGTEVNLEEKRTDNNQSNSTNSSEAAACLDEDSEPATESSIEDDVDSDEDWNPDDKLLLSAETPNESDVDTDYEDGDDPVLLKHRRLCTDCGMFFLQHHTCEHKIKPFSCNICGKRFPSQGALSNHNKIHEEGLKYRCNYCFVTFRTKVDKINHEQMHRSEEKPFKCPDCSESFTKFKERRTHLKYHRRFKQLKCHICGRELCHRKALRRHLLVHTGQKPHKCSVCQRGFSQSGHLKSHMRLHTMEKPYKCQLCEQSFNHNVSLKSHLQRYHSPHSRGDDVEECDKKEEKRRNNKSRAVRPRGRPKRKAAEQMENTNTGKVQRKRTSSREDEGKGRADL
ncbi:uncharacterized protein ACBR49_011808 [Aulostomus maculatus]